MFTTFKLCCRGDEEDGMSGCLSAGGAQGELGVAEVFFCDFTFKLSLMFDEVCKISDTTAV